MKFIDKARAQEDSIKYFFGFWYGFLKVSDSHGIGDEIDLIDIFDYWGIFAVVKNIVFSLF
ncbi:hypothetical protein [Flavobacterium sp. FlaQc-48]|uniref:hypothetical protein n=1 Tax=Flavobacterium sp. FlaQc-48 TaxID=3374181 RepID=UPI0037584E16